MFSGLTRFLGPTGSLRGKLVRGGLGSIGLKTFYLAAQFGVGVALARMLGPESLGLYAFTLALIQLMAVAGQFGFPLFLVRTVSVYRAEANYALLRGLCRSGLLMVLAISCLVAGVAALAVVLLDMWGGRLSSQVLLTGLFLVPLFALLAATRGSIQGLGHPLAAQLPEQVLRPVLLVLGLITIVLADLNLTVTVALWLNIATASLALCAGLVLLSFHMPAETRHLPPETRTASWLHASLPFLLLAGGQVMMYQTDVVMLGIMATETAVGLYRVAIQVADGLGVVLFGISIVIAPHLARLHTEGDWRTIQLILVNGHRIGAAALLVPVVLIAIFAAPLLHLIFGAAFVSADGAMAVLVLGKLAYATIGFAGLALSMLGRPGMAATITAITVLLNVMLNLILIPHFGIVGAAIATSTSAVLVNAGSMILIARMYGRNCSAFGRVLPAPALTKETNQ